MFIGYQNNIARYIKSTREELEVIPHVSFDRIEEVPFAEMYNGVIYTSEFELTRIKIIAVEETRASLYAAKVDPITAHINRLRDEEVVTPELEAEIATLIEKRKLLVEEIKAQHPYPVVEENSEAEVVVSNLENTTKEID